jgi:hypothetical protein
MSLNYTPLRHKMLAAIADGQRPSVGLPWLDSEHRRTAEEVRAAGLVVRGSAQPWLTTSGREVLAEWTERHGEPTP